MSPLSILKMLHHIDTAPGMNPILFGAITEVVINWYHGTEKRWLVDRINNEIKQKHNSY